MAQTKINLTEQSIGSLPYGSTVPSAIDQTQSFTFVPPLIASGGVETLSQGFTTVGALNTPRENNTVTLLQNGMILVVGGDDGGGTILSSAEFYNPSTQVWTNTGSMATARKYHRAVLLPNGNVLVAGGSTPGNTAVATCEIYNTNTGLWTSTGSLPGVHSQFYMALLNTGFVLAAGGINNSHSAINTAALYNTNTGTWAATGTMTGARFHFPSTDSERMVILSNGKALIAGGTANGSIGLSTTTIYDPIAATWSSAGSLSVGRFSHNLVALRNGMALVIGGTTNESIALATTELYDPVGNSWSLSGSLNQYRGDCFSQLLPNGNILTGAGVGFDGGFFSSTEVYNVGTATWSFSTDMAGADEGNSSCVMATGQIMIAGGLETATPQVYGSFISVINATATGVNLISNGTVVTSTITANVINSSDVSILASGSSGNVNLALDASPITISANFALNSSQAFLTLGAGPSVTGGVQLNTIFGQYSILDVTNGHAFSIGLSGNLINAYSILFPTDQGGAGTTLQNDGTGNLTWVVGGVPSNVVQTVDSTQSSTGGSSYAVTNTTVTITPSSSSAQIKITICGLIETSGNTGFATIFKDGVNVVADQMVFATLPSDNVTMQWLDMPGDISPHTYAVYIRAPNADGNINWGGNSTSMTAVAEEIH